MMMLFDDPKKTGFFVSFFFFFALFERPVLGSHGAYQEHQIVTWCWSWKGVETTETNVWSPQADVPFFNMNMANIFGNVRKVTKLLDQPTCCFHSFLRSFPRLHLQWLGLSEISGLEAFDAAEVDFRCFFFPTFIFPIFQN